VREGFAAALLLRCDVPGRLEEGAEKGALREGKAIHPACSLAAVKMGVMTLSPPMPKLAQSKA